jgi:hypothetical protein
MSHYNLTNLQNYFLIANTFSFYILALLLYGKYTAPIISEVIPVVSEIANMPNVESFLRAFYDTADKIIYENRNALFLISCDAYRSILSTIDEFKYMSQTDLANEYARQVIEAIKADPIIYEKLLKNDVIINYTASIIREGFLTESIAEVLGVADL